MEIGTKVKKEAYIVDTAMVTGLGNSLDVNWEKLCLGESAMGLVEHFSTERLNFHKACCIGDLWNRDYSNRICELTKRALEQLSFVPRDTFVIWTGVKGNVEYIEKSFSNTVPTDDQLFLPFHYRRWVCQYLGLNNVGMEVNAACASSTVGLAIAGQLISQGEYSSVLVCGADIVSRFTFMGFSALRALSQTDCRPFDQDRDGLCLGDGASAILLVNDETAQQYGYKKLSRLTGWGIGNDANHITGPARDASGLISSIKTSLEMSELSPESIQAFCAHGTGTVYNDAMELTAVEEIFGKRRFPIFSVKGAIGHTLGAAGSIETAFCTRALQEKTIPPTVGLRVAESRAEGRVSPTSQAFEGDTILTTNSGFGGINAALILMQNTG